MKYRVEVGLALFMLLFLLSLGDPVVHIGDLLRRIPELPADAHALYFSRSDGTLDWNAYNFAATHTQYDLAPRVVEVHPNGSVDLKSFKWLLAYQMDAGSLAQVTAENNLRVVQTCYKIVILARNP